MAIETIESGIPGLDELFTLGFPKGKTILLSGPPGAGKTVLGIQFLIHGALVNSEPAVLVTFDDLPNHVRKDCLTFGWDLRELETIDPPLLSIVDGFASRVGLTTKERFSIRANVDSLLITLMEVLDETGATRIVVDSLTSLAATVKTHSQVRKEILTMSAVLGDQGCTTLLTAEIGGMASHADTMTTGGGSGGSGRFGVEEYSAQGSIVLSYIEQPDGSFKRAILIQKMRGSQHIFGWREFEITGQGAVVRPDLAITRIHP
ncbi:MAG: ATPase domain-containing protein [Promethearchaeota archaeon]